MIITRRLASWTLTGIGLGLVVGCVSNTQPLIVSVDLQPSTSVDTLYLKLAETVPAQFPTKAQPLPERPYCKNPQTQAEINNCAILSAQASDKRLNRLYQQLRANLKGTTQEKLLIEAQLAWIEFRDANCAFEKSRFAGGSIVPTIYYSCINEITKQRITNLESYLQQR